MRQQIHCHWGKQRLFSELFQQCSACVWIGAVWLQLPFSERCPTNVSFCSVFLLICHSQKLSGAMVSLVHGDHLSMVKWLNQSFHFSMSMMCAPIYPAFATMLVLKILVMQLLDIWHDSTSTWQLVHWIAVHTAVIHYNQFYDWVG